MPKSKHSGMISQKTLDELRERGMDIRTINRTTTDAMGIKTEVVDAQAAEDADFVVCGYWPGSYPDNILTWCADCRAAIVHRPHAPTRPAKVCIPCASKRMEKDAEEAL